jgi:transcriptional regulator with XRE-family HTH domain
LGQELRRLRELKGMTAEEVAERLLVSQSKISRLENGRRSISQRDVRDLCGVYEVEDQRMVDSLMEMAKDSRQQGWWHAFGDVPYSVYIGLETDAASLRVYDPQVVPGLLQTRQYAEALISGALPETALTEIEKRVQVRMRRQERVSSGENPLRLWSVMDVQNGAVAQPRRNQPPAGRQAGPGARPAPEPARGVPAQPHRGPLARVVAH